MTRAELHFHLLPGVDDGPRDLDESLELARMAVADGTGTIVCTSHARDVDAATVPGRVAELRAALRAADIPLELLAGLEVAHDDVAGMDAAALEVAAQGPPDGRWVLLEAPLDMLGAGLADGFLEALAELAARGYGVLAGHPERCGELMEGDGIATLLAAGAPLQVNGSSLLGRHGEAPRRRALELLAAGRVDVIASDAHRPSRGPVLGAAVAAAIEAGADRAAAEAMVAATPRALLERGLRAPALER